MKRPLGILAAAILSLGLLGSIPARAATSNSPSGGTLFHHHHHDDDGDDGDGDSDDDFGRGRSRCSGIIAICLG